MRRRFWNIGLIALVNGVVLGLLAFAFLVHRPITSWQIPLYASPYRFYANDKLLVTWNYSRGRRLQVWNVQTGLQLADLTVKDCIGDPQFTISADGSTMAWVQQHDGFDELMFMKFDDHRTQAIVQSTPAKPEGECYHINPLLSSDGSKLAFHHSRPRCIRIWDTTTNQSILTHGDGHFIMISSPDGKRLLTWSTAGNVPGDSQLWDFDTGKRVLDLEATPVRYTVAREFSQDSQSIHGLQYLYQSEGWNTISMLKWNLIDGQKTEIWTKTLDHKLQDCRQSLFTSAFMLYESLESSTIQLFDMVSAKLIGSFDEHVLDESPVDKPRPKYGGTPHPVFLFGVGGAGRLAVSRDHKYLVSAYEFRDATRAWWRKQLSHVKLERLVPRDTGIRMKVIDLETFKTDFVYDLTHGHFESGHRVAFAASSNLLAVAKDHGNNNTIELWKIPRQFQWGNFFLSTMLLGILWWVIYRIRLRRPLPIAQKHSKSNTPIVIQ